MVTTFNSARHPGYKFYMSMRPIDDENPRLRAYEIFHREGNHGEFWRFEETTQAGVNGSSMEVVGRHCDMLMQLSKLLSMDNELAQAKFEFSSEPL